MASVFWCLVLSKYSHYFRISKVISTVLYNYAVAAPNPGFYCQMSEYRSTEIVNVGLRPEKFHYLNLTMFEVRRICTDTCHASSYDVGTI